MAADKQASTAVLIKAIGDNVAQTVNPAMVKIEKQLTDLTAQLAQLLINSNSADVSLQALTAAVNSGASAKKAVKGTGKAAAAGKASADKKSAMPTNSMLYFRMRWIQEEQYRTEWREIDDTLDGLLQADPTVTKKAADSAERYSAESNFLWRNVLNDAQKKEIKAEYDTYKKSQTEGDDAELQADA
jgi:hypothetical protein